MYRCRNRYVHACIYLQIYLHNIMFINNVLSQNGFLNGFLAPVYRWIPVDKLETDPSLCANRLMYLFDLLVIIQPEASMLLKTKNYNIGQNH
jgi:hypothetical protein